MAEPTTQTPNTEVPPQGGTPEPKSETPKTEVPAGKPSLITQDPNQTPQGEPKKEEPKPDEQPKAEDIQIKLPEGVKVDEKFMGDFTKVAKELGLKSDGAQKLVDLHLQFVDKLSKEFADNATKQQDEWYQSLEKDPDIGGSKLKETAVSVHKAVEKFGGKEFREAVDEAGLGNWPPLVKFLHKVGLALKDDTAGKEKGASTPANDEEAFIRELYPNSPGMFKQS